LLKKLPAFYRDLVFSKKFRFSGKRPAYCDITTQQGQENMKRDNNIDELFEEFGSSLSVNLIVQGPRDVLDTRGQLLKGCVQCDKRISEFMLSQDIACALTAGNYEIKSDAAKFLQKICNNAISLADASEKTDGLVRASGDAAIVLKTLKEVDSKKFLEVLCILW
jgi:hypothetical protein